jgi:hypothetical protein
MKKEKYIIEIEMPDGDSASSTYIRDVIQSDCDIEDEGRWKISVKEYWKPSEEQMKTLNEVINYCANGKEAYLNDYIYNRLIDLRDELNKL